MTRLRLACNRRNALTMAFPKHCGANVTGTGGHPHPHGASAPIAPTACAPARSRADAPSTPPNAATASPPGARRAIVAHRTGPSPNAPGWLAVANAGDKNANTAPAALARRNVATPCAELVTGPHSPARPRTRRPSRKCTPAPTARANRASPATTNTLRRRRHIAAKSRASPARPGTPSSRSTTPHNPRGNPATAARGSPSRAISVNSHSTGNRAPPTAAPSRANRRLTARAQATSFPSMSAPATTTPSYSHVAAGLSAVHARIAAATAAAARPPGSATLVAVSKTHPVEAVLAALAAGQTIFGENRVQEAAAKFPPLRATHPTLRLHLIGGLQTNKARDAVRLADVIEVLDRPRLADAIADAIQREGRAPDLLIQVNVGDEPQKAGIPTAEADAFITACQARFGPALTGLMCIPPAEGDPAPHFAWLATCATRHGLAVLSMGMSGDFETAITHGATHVRIGTAIFGSRG